MNLFLICLTIFFSLALIVLVTLLPRESQRFSSDRNSSIGRSGYWESKKLLKILTLISSLALLLLLLIFMIINR